MVRGFLLHFFCCMVSLKVDQFRKILLDHKLFITWHCRQRLADKHKKAAIAGYATIAAFFTVFDQFTTGTNGMIIIARPFIFCRFCIFS